MRDSNVGWVVGTIESCRYDMININAILVKLQIDGLGAEKTVARLSLMEFMQKACSFLGSQTVKVK